LIKRDIPIYIFLSITGCVVGYLVVKYDEELEVLLQ